jgi:sucrose-6-phosphate hydrolase SacC (GH32 family)
VVDWNNTACLQTGDEKTMVCVYTAAGSPVTQCIAYSNDRGRTWTKYEKNPVLPHIVGSNRDPKVIWYEPEQKWVMALYLDGNDYALFESRDLKQWGKLCDVTIPGTSECPEFFEIAVEGNKGDTRWVFYGGNGQYLLGRFDGTTFVKESGPHPLNFGDCFYASQTFNNLPAGDGRRILMAWGTVGMPDMPFNQMMDFPVELTLRATEAGPRLFANPVREIEKLHGKKRAWRDLRLEPGDNPLAGLEGELLNLRAEFEVGQAQQLGFTVRGLPIVYDAAQQTLSCRDKTATLRPVGGALRLQLLADRASVEIFGNEGRVYMPMGHLAPEDTRGLEVFAQGGAARVKSLEVHELRSAWER